MQDLCCQEGGLFQRDQVAAVDLLVAGAGNGRGEAADQCGRHHLVLAAADHRRGRRLIETGARHPRNRIDWPLVGIFAQRGKNRPNRIGLTKKVAVGIVGDSKKVAEGILAKLSPKAGDAARDERKALIATSCSRPSMI